MTKLIIIRGNSGSGKSTLATRLQQELGLGTMLISQDTIRREILRVKDGSGNLAINLIKEMAEFGANHCDFVIIEGILKRNWYGEMLENLVSEFDAVHTYYYDISFEETVRRHQTKPNRMEFTSEDMKRWWNENDVLNIQNEQILSEDMSIEDCLELILHDL